MAELDNHCKNSFLQHQWHGCNSPIGHGLGLLCVGDYLRAYRPKPHPIPPGHHQLDLTNASTPARHHVESRRPTVTNCTPVSGRFLAQPH